MRSLTILFILVFLGRGFIMTCVGGLLLGVLSVYSVVGLIFIVMIPVILIGLLARFIAGK